MRLGPVFADGELRRIYERALNVIETVGLDVENANARDKLGKAPGFKLKGDRVVIERAAVAEAFGARNERCGVNFPCSPPEDWDVSNLSLGAGTHAHHVVRCGEDAPQAITTDDVIEGIRLVRALAGENVVGSVIGAPQDVPEPLRPAHIQMLSCIHAGRATYAPVMNPEQFETNLRMRNAMGIEPSASCHLPSPLRLAGNEFDLSLQFAGRIKHVGVANMPQLGVTAPASVPGLLIQSTAEMLGALCAMGVLMPGVEVDFSIGAHGTDFRTGGMVYGSPGALLVEAGLFHLRGWLLGGWGGRRFMRTQAKLPGMQSAADKAAGGMLGALLGCHSFSGAGYLSLDEVWSPEQMLLDVEVRDFVAQAAGDFSRDEDAFDVSVIEECAPKNEYMSSEETLKRFREFAWAGRLFRYDMLGSWEADGRPLERARLTEIVRELVSRELPPPLDDDRARKVMDIYEDVKSAIG